MSRSLTFVCNGSAVDRKNSRLGSAQARWNDYVGTAAAEDADAVLNSRSLYEIAELDRNRWTIIGMDLSIGETSEPIVLYVVDRAADADDVGGVDEVAVTAVPLGSATTLDDFLREAFKRLSVRLVSRLMVDKRLIVAGQALSLAPPV